MARLTPRILGDTMRRPLPVLRDGPPLKLAGLRQHHPLAAAPQAILRQWALFAARGPGDRALSPIGYGVICGRDLEADTIEYMCAVEVADLDDLRPGVVRLALPAARYAVIAHEGPVARITESWHALAAWLASSGHVRADSPAFERYGPGFDPVRGEGDIEIWVPIAP